MILYGLSKGADCLALLHRQSVKKGELEDYWEHRVALSPASIGRALFTEDAEYHEDPFGAPLVGHNAPRASLLDASASQRDVEFTIERGKLWMLQTRNGKRTAKAIVKIAVDMANEKLISREEAVLRVTPEDVDALLHPAFDPTAMKEAEAQA